MKIELTKTDTIIVLEILSTRGRFMVSNYDPKHTDYAREQANELARVLDCSVEEVAQ